jgi:hypothetical protein
VFHCATSACASPPEGRRFSHSWTSDGAAQKLSDFPVTRAALDGAPEAQSPNRNSQEPREFLLVK